MVTVTSQKITRSFLKVNQVTLDALEAFLVLGNNLKLSLLDLHPLDSANSAPHDCDFLKIQYLGQEVKLIQKMGFYLTSLHRPTTLGRISSKGSLSGMIRGPFNPVAMKGAVAVL